MNNRFAEYGDISLGTNVFIGKYCAFGCPKEQNARRHLDDGVSLQQLVAPTRISDNCIIGNHVCIYEGVHISSGTFIEDHVRIGYDCRIGHNVRIMYGSYICDRVAIGDNARIGGFVCDGAQIGERSSIMGDLVHEYSRPHLGWWEVNEPSPTIESHVIVGLRAIVVGGIRISSHVYVTSGAVVTKSVPPNHIVRGTNELIPLKDWPGNKLADLIRHWDEQ